MSKSDIEGKTALVTGASKGIGKAISLALADLGVKVAVNYNSSEAKAKEVAKQISDSGGESLIVHADVSDAKAVTAMVHKVNDAWGQVDILVNNAGIISDGLLLRMSDESWDRVIGVNLNGTFYCARAVLRTMVRQRWGRIINIGSVVGLRGNIGQTNYSASKAALLGFSKSLAKEVATRNITVNIVTPGYISTETVADLTKEQKDRIMTWIPQGHFGETEDIANMVAYLASKKARYITGQVISVDGGMAI